jgi:hypothetical protein
MARQYTQCYDHTPGDKPFSKDDLLALVAGNAWPGGTVAILAFLAGAPGARQAPLDGDRGLLAHEALGVERVYEKAVAHLRRLSGLDQECHGGYKRLTGWILRL